MVKLGIIKEDNIMSDNTNNGFPVPEEPRTREEQYLSAIAGVTEATEIPEKPRTRVEAYLNEIVENGGGSVYDKLEAGTNINIEETSDGKAKISATGEVSSEDTYAREQIANHIADKDNPHEVSAADVGLGNCDNTSDLNKPISTATQTALNLKADKTELPEVPITIVKVNNEPLVPASGAVNITVPTQASDVHALADSVKYAGASTAGGSATSAAKLDTASAGSATQPVYFANGIPTATSYSLEKSVPSNAVFTDTTYESKAAASGGTDVSLCTTGEKYTWNSKQNAIDSSHKLSADLVDDTSTTNKFATAAELEQIQTNKNNILSNTLNGGGINKLQVTATTTTVNGIIFTVNADKTITATGSITDNTQNAIFTIGAYTAVSGDVLSEGFVKANSKAYVYARGGSTNLASEPYIAILAGDIGVQRDYACVIRSDTVGQVNITFKPMICNSDSYAKSGVYQPYALSNAELTAAIQALQTQLANQ